MLKIYVLWLLLAPATWCCCQNLMRNGSFEQGADLCEINSDLDKVASGWSSPSGGTPDVYSVKIDAQCFTAMPYSRFRIENPSNNIGSQSPRTGDRLAGIYTDSGRPGVPGASYREYLQVQLDRPVKPGRSYCFSMYVSLGGTSGYASNKIGVALSGQAINTFPNFAPLSLNPAFTDERIITDSTGWVKVEANLVPAQAAEYLIIGNFFDDDHTDRIIFNAEKLNDWLMTHAYYFVDDISLEENPLDAFTLSGDRDVCEGDMIHITANAGVDGVQWSTVDDPLTVIATGPELSLTARQTTTYRATVAGCGKLVTGTVKVTVHAPPVVDLGADLTICHGETVTLDAGADGVNYQWNAGGNGQFLNVNDAGLYSVNVENAHHCKATDQINIGVDFRPLDEFIFSGNTEVCEGEQIDISVNTGTTGITWTTLQNPANIITTGPQLSLTARQTTTYQVSAQGCGKLVTDTLRVSVYTPPPVQLGDDLTICEGDSVMLDAGDSATRYQWNVGSQDQVLTVKEAGTYSVEVVNAHNCKATDEVDISISFAPHIDLGRDTLLCNGRFFPLQGGTATKYLWSSGAEAASFTPELSGVYWLRAENDCGVDIDSISVVSIANLFIPNVVTLNDDAFNNTLSIEGLGDAPAGNMKIYNRWGREIYAAPNYRNEWPVAQNYPDAGVYFYMYAIPGCPAYKGWVHVVK